MRSPAASALRKKEEHAVASIPELGGLTMHVDEKGVAEKGKWQGEGLQCMGKRSTMPMPSRYRAICATNKSAKPVFSQGGWRN